MNGSTLNGQQLAVSIKMTKQESSIQRAQKMAYRVNFYLHVDRCTEFYVESVV